jgi:hypothetical protein
MVSDVIEMLHTVAVEQSRLPWCLVLFHHTFEQKKRLSNFADSRVRQVHSLPHTAQKQRLSNSFLPVF